MTIDDFEWVEQLFDEHFLIHKHVNLKIARVYNFQGWWVTVWKDPLPIAKNIDNFNAAKVIAALHANKHMEEYSEHVRTQRPAVRPRPFSAGPSKIPKGVFKVG
jgi:hypothetical protein